MKSWIIMKGPIEGRDTSTVVGSPTNGPVEVVALEDVRRALYAHDIQARHTFRRDAAWDAFKDGLGK